MAQGVPAGYIHHWGYKGRWTERKLRRGLWRFTFKATKGKRARSYGNFGKGTKGAWKINAIQYITKIGKGRYQTNMIGYKKPLRFYVRRGSRRKY